jgi:hypothetical protein
MPFTIKSKKISTNDSVQHSATTTTCQSDQIVCINTSTQGAYGFGFVFSLMRGVTSIGEYNLLSK